MGRTLTPLRPCGHVEIDGRRIDALAEEGFVPEGSQVRVLRVRSGQLVVRGMLDSTRSPERTNTSTTHERTRPETGPSHIATAAEAVSILEEAP